MRTYLAVLLLMCFSVSFALSIDDAIETGLQNSPMIKSAQESLNQAKWDYYQSNFELLPSANMAGSFTVYDPEIDQSGKKLEESRSYGFNASMPLFAGGKIWQNSRIKYNAYQIAKDNFQNKKLEVIAEIENKFLTALEMQKLFEIAEKEYQNAQLHEEIAETRYANGSIAEADYLRMRSQTVQKRVRLIQTNTNYLTAMIDLKNILSIDFEIELTDLDDSIFTEYTLDIAEWDLEQIENFLQRIAKKSIANNLTLKINEKNIENSKKVLLIASGNFLPNINLSYNKNWQKNNLQDSYAEAGTIMLNASVPIFPVGNNVSNYLKNKSNLRKSEYDFINTHNTISLNIRSVALNWVSSVQTAESARLSLDYAQRSWEQMNQRYRSGVISGADMLDADIMLSNANYQYINSKYNILRNKSNLKKILNVENNEDFGKFIKQMEEM